MSVMPAPVPFRIRVGVLGLPGAGTALTEAARPAIAERFLEIVQEEAPALLDDESRRGLDRARTTEVAYAVVSWSGDGVVQRLFDHLRLPARVRRDVAPARTGETRDPTERLVDECDVLLVLSDGPLSESEARGGSGVPALVYAELRTRPVIVFSLRDRSMLQVGRSGIDARSVSRIDLYNRTRLTEEKAAAYSANELRELFGPYPDDERHGEPHPGSDVPQGNRRLVAYHLVPHYVKASSLSKACQRTYLWTALLVYVLAVTAVALVALGALVHDLATLAFALELGALLAILLLITIADRRRTHSKWLEARFLTERIRHAMYLVACGVRPVDHRIPPHVGGREVPDLWMLNVFEEICSALPEDLPKCDERSCPLLSDFVRGTWVGGQLRYHRRRSRRLRRWNRILERAGVCMFGLAILAAASHLAFLAAHALHLAPWLEGGITWIALVLPAAGAAVGGFRAHREFSRLSKRSAAMAHALEDMEARLERVSNPADLEAMLGQIESWMVEEAQGWLMLMGPLKLEAT